MYISDKNFIKMAIVPYFLGTLAENGITVEKDKFFKLCKTFYVDLCDKYLKDIQKINNRLDNLVFKIFNEIRDVQKKEINAHKAIIALNTVIQLAISNGDYADDFANQLISLLEPFQELESQIEMADEEWLALKESADKRAKNIYEIIFKNNA
jgi:hypothetical protein